MSARLFRKDYRAMAQAFHRCYQNDQGFDRAITCLIPLLYKWNRNFNEQEFWSAIRLGHDYLQQRPKGEHYVR